MLAVLGLGNPGRRYSGTRHNVGYMVLDALIESAGARFSERSKADTARIEIAGENVVLAKPTTFMNLSGTAVKGILKRHFIPLDQVLVVCDDFNLPLGRLRLRPSGSAGGHNGLGSIIDSLGSNEFPRLRLGVGEPKGDVVNYVLSSFSASERPELKSMVETAAQAVKDWVEHGISWTMNQYNINRP
jgi:peptidyl-tRNA hydrolase, PTH1 family